MYQLFEASQAKAVHKYIKINREPDIIVLVQFYFNAICLKKKFLNINFQIISDYGAQDVAKRVT